MITARVSVSDPRLPTFTQVSAVQEFINNRLAPRQFRLVVKRTSIDVVGPEPDPAPTVLEGADWPWVTPPIVPLLERTNDSDGNAEPEEPADPQAGDAGGDQDSGAGARPVAPAAD